MFVDMTHLLFAALYDIANPLLLKLPSVTKTTCNAFVTVCSIDGLF